MASINFIQPTYADWLLARAAIEGITYYVQHDFHYIAVVIQELDNGLVNVYLVELTRTPEDLNTADFEANVKGTATQVVSVDDAIAARLQ